jgi:predicted flap endonuclease-1-like 5' DNA nuclease
MTPIIAFVAGLLIGWLVEWVIDRFYWRRRLKSLQDNEAQHHQRILSLDRGAAALDAAYKQAQQQVQSLQADLNLHRQAEKSYQDELAASQRESLAQGEKAAQLQAQNERQEEMISRLEQELSELRTQPQVPPLLIPDPLEEIHGIGPAIAKKLNQAGVHTFEQLAGQTPTWLRSVLGPTTGRLADEDELLQQAHQLADRKARQASDQK